MEVDCIAMALGKGGKRAKVQIGCDGKVSCWDELARELVSFLLGRTT